VADLTTVADDEAVVHDGFDVRHHDGLDPDTQYSIDGFELHTLPRPGEHLVTFATVNDVHFGETECGIIEGLDIGPVLRADPGEPPYPETMNRAAIAEIAAIDPAALVVKGDLTADGTEEQYQQFLDAYTPAFGERLHVIRGNHDSYYGASYASEPTQRVDLPGVTLALIDTSIQHSATGTVQPEQLEWLDTLGAEADRPVLLFGHHHPWNPDGVERPDTYFGIHPDASEELVEVVARRPRIVGYFAGHTHRNRVRRFSATGVVPWVEVACVKDFPGAWAEYRVFDGGILQVHRRISSPEALSWSERTRGMYAGTYEEYALGTLDQRCFVISHR
jgi:Icc protein